MGGTRRFGPPRPSQQVGTYSVIGRKFSNFGDGSRSMPHRDRAIGGAKRIVVRCGGCRKSTDQC
jgi:hypothetical protein